MTFACDIDLGDVVYKLIRETTSLIYIHNFNPIPNNSYDRKHVPDKLHFCCDLDLSNIIVK